MKTNKIQEEFQGKDEKIPVRLNKFLSEAGICSRREADRLIEEGMVLVDGIVAVTGQKVLPTQKIEVKGKQAKRETEMILLAVNKPRGVVCSTDDRWGDITIDAFLNYPKRVFPIGRLDKDSEGLLLMTNNGEILNKIMRAGNFHEKEYVVDVNKEITEEFLLRMQKGVRLPELNVVTRRCKVVKLGEKQFSIILTQGLNRQIRRMCQALGYKVTKLKRVRIMNIHLDDMQTGTYRKVTEEEMDTLYEMLKGSRS